MRSFRKFISRRILYSNIFVIFLFLISVSLGIVNYFLINFENDYRSALSLINSSIRTLNLISISDEPIDEYIELQQNLKNLEKALKFFPDSLITFDFDKNIIDDLRSGANPRDYITILGDNARALADYFYSFSRALSTYALVSVLLTSLLIISSLITLKQMKSLYDELFSKLTIGIQNLQSVLNYEKPSYLEKSEWIEESAFVTEINRSLRRIDSDRQLIDIGSIGSIEDYIPKIMGIISSQMRCDRIGLAFIDLDNNVIAESAIHKDHKMFLDQGFSEAISNTTLEELTEERKGRVINDLEKHYATVNQSKATELILKENIKSNITIPLFSQKTCHGFAFISSTKKNSYTENDLEFAWRIFTTVSPTLLNKYIEQQTIASTANAFVTLMEKKDNETSLHITRMARYSYTIAKQLYIDKNPKISHKSLREILLFAPLHDIGKIGIPDSILLKEGPLTKDEFKFMKTHVDMGYQVLTKMHNDLKARSGLDYLQTAINIIVGHHEKYDGTGYPKGLKGEDIPVEGQISALADVFDALTSKRPYKEAWDFQKAVDYIVSQKNSHFDPIVVQAFENSLLDIRKIYNQYKEV